MMAILVFWLLFALVVAIAAESRGRLGLGWFFLAVLLSPLIGLILVLVLPNLRHERLMARLANRDKIHGDARSAPFELDGVYAEVPYRVLGDGSVEALMRGGVVRFRSADHLFQTLGGGSAIEAATTRTPPTALDRPGKMSPPLWKVLVVVGLAVGVGLYSFKLVEDRSRQAEFSPGTTVAAETTATNQADDDAKALATASAVNKKWEVTFDKTGKYPDGQNADTHNTAYAAVVKIAPESPSYASARMLVDKFAMRQLKINAIERAKSPPTPENPKIKLGTLDWSYNLIRGSFTIENPNAFAIADVKINCRLEGESGTTISELNFVIYVVVPARAQKIIKAHDFGYSSSQAKTIACSSTGYTRR